MQGLPSWWAESNCNLQNIIISLCHLRVRLQHTHGGLELEQHQDEHDRDQKQHRHQEQSYQPRMKLSDLNLNAISILYLTYDLSRPTIIINLDLNRGAIQTPWCLQMNIVLSVVVIEIRVQ